MNSILHYRFYLFVAGWLLVAGSPLLAQNVSPTETLLAYYCQPCGSSCDKERHEKPGTCQHCGMPLVQRSVALLDSLTRNQKQLKKRNVAIFIHDGVEILDFAGPSEVFASTEGFNVYTVSLSKEPIISQGFIKITPTYSLTDCPKPDIVVLPGGDTGPFIENKPLIDWIKNAATQAEIMLSVCTGAGLLAKAGLLDGKQATTFHAYIEPLQRATPRAEILSNTRFVDNGQIITTAGVSAGIDGALHVVAKLKGQAVATQTARYMEYDKWKPEEGLIVKPSRAQPPTIPAKVQQQIDALFADYNRPGRPGFSLGIFAPSTVLYSKAYGMANLDYNLPNSSATVYNIASLSKQFTAACVALLILRDSLSLEDPVAKYVPQVGQYTDTIRIKHLVYMTSGIHEYHRLPRKNGLNWNLYDYFTVDTAIQAALSQHKLDFVPGSQWAYSNVNYMLLTKIVEKVSGKRFSQFAQENLFAPLGMSSTQVNDDVTLVIPNRATGYIPLTPSLIEQTQQAGYYLKDRAGYAQVHRNAPHYGGSGVFISINDWFLWNQNFYTHKLGGKRFFDLMHQRMRFKHSKDNDAFGLVFGQFEGEEIIWYSGGDIGFNSYFMRFPKQELTVVCFSNIDSAGEAEKLAHQVGRILIQNKVLAITKSGAE